MKKLVFRMKQYAKMFVQQVYLPSIYNRHRNKPIEKGLVLLADAHSDTLPQNLEGVEAALKEAGYRTVRCVSNYGKMGFRSAAKEMASFMELYAKAQYVFLCDYFLPVSSCDKRPETKVIQLWHAGGMLKKFGYDSPDDIPPMYRGKVIRNYDLVTVSAPKCVKPFASAMGLPENHVEPLGICRTDSFFDPVFLEGCRREFYEAYPQLRNKKLVLWAPTFRGNAGAPVTIGLEAIRALQKQLGDDYHVLIKLHPHAEQKERASNCPIPTHRLLPVVDLLISDFSSIVFDYALLEKPAVLFAPDYDEYTRSRGFYLDYQRDLPYPLITKERDLCAAVVQSLQSPPSSRLREFRETFMGSCDGRVTQRVLQRMAQL